MHVTIDGCVSLPLIHEPVADPELESQFQYDVPVKYNVPVKVGLSHSVLARQAIKEEKVVQLPM